jgi:hypothetical protein
MYVPRLGCAGESRVWRCARVGLLLAATLLVSIVAAPRPSEARAAAQLGEGARSRTGQHQRGGGERGGMRPLGGSGREEGLVRIGSRLFAHCSRSRWSSAVPITVPAVALFPRQRIQSTAAPDDQTHRTSASHTLTLHPHSTAPVSLLTATGSSDRMERNRHRATSNGECGSGT